MMKMLGNKHLAAQHGQRTRCHYNVHFKIINLKVEDSVEECATQSQGCESSHMLSIEIT